MTALFEMRIRVGGDPREFSEFLTLCDELAKLNHPACPDVDWAKVEQLCLTLFERNGAEVQTVAYFALARSYLHGLEGMTEGVTLIEALGREWSYLWPPMSSVRVDILAWLFAQLQPLLRSMDTGPRSVPALIQLDAKLERLNRLLLREVEFPIVTLASLRQQVSNLMYRLERNAVAGQPVLQMTRAPEPAFVMPVVILPTPRLPEVPALALETTRRRTGWWLLALAAVLAIASWVGWKTWLASPESDGSTSLVSIFKQEQTIPDPLHLDSLSLFDAGKAELKPDSDKVLINALLAIKSRPGWLIVIVGHTDATGDPQQNLQLSQARASAVRDWLQRVGEIPSGCFAVQGVAASLPIASNDTEAGRIANRRVDIRLVPQTGGCG
ncbi:OmpA family protein [Pseudomonas sp. G.S.17]|uniref:OmpA family protein n=1 Tax=Pseudomonas sp. G.S.17 TaxID=3137451 RepID=UPI00311C89E6